MTKSFTFVSEGVKDPLMLPKLACFLSVAKKIEPFLVSFQTDSPLVPFLYGDLLKVRAQWKKVLTRRFDDLRKVASKS